VPSAFKPTSFLAREEGTVRSVFHDKPDVVLGKQITHTINVRVGFVIYLTTSPYQKLTFSISHTQT
jgi:hypothetical protein